MNVETVKEVVEAIKTLNLNIDSETGKQALIGAIQELKPIIMLMVLKDWVMPFLGLITTIVCVVVISKACTKIWVNKGE